MDFKDYYKLPLHIDQYCFYFVNTFDNEMALNYLNESAVERNDSAELLDLVGAINGYIPGEFNATINEEDETIIDINGVPTLMIRGWGRLIGYVLPQEAVKIQNEFRDFIINQLTRNYLQ